MMFRSTLQTNPPDPRAAAAREAAARVLAVKACLLLAFGVVAFRLVEIQVLKASTYQEIARRQNSANVPLPALRGVIMDRQGRTLIGNSTLVSFGADPRMVGDSAAEVARTFAEVFQKPRTEYLDRLRKEESRFVWLERRVDSRYRKRIPSGRFNGVVVLDEPRRLYHYAHVAGQVLGFTDIDSRGVSGLELELDSLLRGTDGRVVMQRDALNRRRPSVDYPRVDPVHGLSAVLTIDIEYQAIVEQELEKGVRANGAESGIAVMLDPGTGEVLAMANFPPIDPSHPGSIDPAAARNRVITDMVEPGSVFKVVTAAAALEGRLVSPHQRFDAEQGEYRVYLANGRPRNVITDTHKYGIITFREAMEVSSNVVMAKISDVIGAEALFTMARRFGFGTETGIALPGEVGGELKSPSHWSGTTLNTMAYGYEVAATPLQIAAAYAAVANHGVLMKPYVVRQIVDDGGSVIREAGPERIRQVVTKKTADTLTGFLCGVVERGTGQLARIRGLDVAGKTGTARKYVDGRYVPGSYIASFVGFFPASDPAVVCLVMLDLPGTPTYSGGLVSAPIFKAIATKIYTSSLRFAPKPGAAPAAIAQRVVPDVMTMKIEAATTLLAARGFTPQAQGEGPLVVKQSPAAGAKVVAGSRVLLVSGESAQRAPKGYAIVPDLRGLPMRRAVNRLALQRLDAVIAGSGLVVSQSPAAGARVKTGARVSITCAAKNLQLLTLY
jgi:cell division protein FtsI/penicillin-binding protein 2